MSAIRLLIVTDGFRFTFGPPNPTTETFTIWELVTTFENSTSPPITVDRAHRKTDPYATSSGITVRENFVFDAAGLDLSVYDVIWMIGDEGSNGGGVSGQKLTDTELLAIWNFMQARGGVFATGDHDGIGSFMCGFVPRVRNMRKWFDRLNPAGDPTPAGFPTNWPSIGPDRADTLQQAPDGNFYFDSQSDAVPQPLTLVSPTHPILMGPSGPVTHFPDHMHEGEVIVPWDLTASISFAGSPAAPEYPSFLGNPWPPAVIATGQVIGGHSTLVEADGSYTGASGASDPSLTNAKTIGVLCAYDGLPLGTGRVVTDSSFHHCLDINLTGDPQGGTNGTGSTTDTHQGFTAASAGTVLADIQAFFLNTAAWLAKPARAITFQLDRDHYGQDEVDAARTQVGGAVITGAFWLAVDGFTPRLLGVTGPGSTGAAPMITFSPSAGVSATCTSVDSTDPGFSPDALQRIRFIYSVSFDATDSAFNFAGLTEPVTLSVNNFQGMSTSAQVTFMKQPDPYILQGPQTWWLSNDVRLVQVVEGDSAFGVTLVPGTDPFVYLQALTSALESAAATGFDTNTTEDAEVISVAPYAFRGLSLRNVYNFAIARVHYQGLAQPANDVRVFFRLFAANSTATDFHADTTYSRDPAAYPVAPANFGQHTIPTPGVVGGAYVTIPCFGARRQDPTQSGAPNSLPQVQFDANNDRNLPATGGPIRDFYYGCLLDINGSAPVLPQTPPAGNANGPWPPSSGVSLEPLRQAFIRNDHQCLVAEICFDPDSIAAGTGPWNSDKLAQRNISWSYAANPGIDVSRGAIETFEVRPSPRGSAQTLPDEIVIEWKNVPAGQPARIYMPAVGADAALALASRLYPTHNLSRIDAATIGCVTGGVTYIPLPEGSGDGANFTGLLQIALPPGIRRGQLYHVVVRQLTNAFGERVPPPVRQPGRAAGGRRQQAAVAPAVLRWRKVLGTFQINIPVSTKELMLPREELRLSIFRWIAEGIDRSDRWWPVFMRYLELIAIRVGELGGDPASIKPSPTGYDGVPQPCPEPPGECHELRYSGKVAALVYDHFGDFDGFILETRDGDQLQFESREDAIEALVREAWEDRIVTTVRVRHEHRHRPISILLQRRSRWRAE